MRLSAPKKNTWWVSLILVVVGFVATFVAIPFVSSVSFWIIIVGYVILLLGTFVKGF